MADIVGGEETARPIVLARKLAAEGMGTALLVAAVIGSGIMAERLAGGNAALALLCNTIATGAMLYVLITLFGPVSGAQMNPAVTLVFALRGEMAWASVGPYIVAQILGGIAGAMLANAMFGLPLVAFSQHARHGGGQWLSEAVATFSLVLTILGTLRARPDAVPAAVALAIVAGYWFTASTSFANPAVTIARALSDSFAGIAPGDVPGFVAAQLGGALAGFLVARRVFA
jgi:glycerol uptake facilitator-like aquaporin